MLEIPLVNGAAEPVSDHQSRAVGVGEDDEAALLGDPAQQGHFSPVIEDAEALRGEDLRVHQVFQGDLVIAPLHNDGFLKAQHDGSPWR